jgi:hypothetical protein
MNNLFYMSLLSSTVFGIIDSLFFLLAEIKIQNQILKIPGFDMNMAELLSGGISASIAIFFSVFISNYIMKKYKISNTSPILDSFGIIIGTFIIIGVYYLIQKIKNKYGKVKKRVRFVPGS